MSRFKPINCAAMAAMMVASLGLAGCQPRRPVPGDIRLHHNEVIIPRNDDLFPGVAPSSDQAHNRNRRRDQKRRAERREAGRNRKTRIGARKKQRIGGRKRGR